MTNLGAEETLYCHPCRANVLCVEQVCPAGHLIPPITMTRYPAPIFPVLTAVSSGLSGSPYEMYRWQGHHYLRFVPIEEIFQMHDNSGPCVGGINSSTFTLVRNAGF